MNIDHLKKVLPSNLRNNATQELVDTLNNISTDPLIRENIKENFISYTKVLLEGKYKITDYINAVAYVSYKLMGYSNIDSYVRTFPDRYNSMVASGKSAKDISSFVAAYNRNQLVNLILEQSLVPIWVVNQDVYQQAINTQADLMRNANSEMVRTQAANSILTHLAKPKEAANMSISINTEDSSGMKELKNTLEELSRQQIAAIQAGTNTKDIAGSKLIIEDAEYENV